MRFVFYAPNVHAGGGAVLARGLLDELSRATFEVVAYLDERYSHPTGSSIQCRKVAPRLDSRWQAELSLARESRKDDFVLSFGNLPPALKNKGRVYVYFHNKNLLSTECLSGFSFKARWRQRLERCWVHLFSGNAYAFVVQTQHMRAVLKREVPRTQVLQMPFAPLSKSLAAPSGVSKKLYDFVYVASGDPHKNHRRLLSAWKQLALDGLTPHLALTISPRTYPDLTQCVRELQSESKLRITNLPDLTQDQVSSLYAESRALIFPSLNESFGLPLVEACRAQLPILASRLDFVEDLIKSAILFDPKDPSSIAGAVREYLARPSPPQAAELRERILSPREFLEGLFEAWRADNL